jgi:hypothetical protein
MPALAAVVPRLEGRQHADDAEHAAGDVDHRTAGPHRPVRQAGHVGQAAHHLRHFIEGRAVFIGPGEKAFQRAVDESRVEGFHILVAEAELVHGAGAEVLDHDVTGANDLLRQGKARIGLEIDTQARLVAVVHTEVAAAAALEAPGVISLQRLDLDHFRAQVGEDHAGRRPHDHVGELHHLDTRQRARCFSHASVLLPVFR